jgi:tetratricopeptide (TPR) repeat protein
LDWEKPKLEDLMGAGGGRRRLDFKNLSNSSRNDSNKPADAQNSAAIQDSGTWISQHPTNYYALIERSKSLVQQKDFESAKVPLQRLVELYPTQTGADYAYAMLAAAYKGLGETNAERQILSRFVEQDGEANEAFLRLAELSAGSGDWPVVVLNARRSLAVNPLVTAPYRLLAQASRHSDDTSQAIQSNRALLQLDPPNPAEVHFELAKAYQRTGDPGAKRQVLEALEEAPRYRQALQLLTEIHDKASPDKSKEPPAEAKP